MEKIDLVIAYVDNTEPVWRKTYIDYFIKRKMPMKVADLNTVRYKDNVRLIDYQLKLVEKNMSWINTIYLLVSNKEQAPQGLSDKVKVILHKDFIPFRYLPTFNSTTIEMFLWNIPNLSEHFIYANDDMLPCRELKPSDFFTEPFEHNNQRKIKIHFDTNTRGELKTQFRYQCENSFYHIMSALKRQTDNTYLRPDHSMTPMIKSHCKGAYDLIKDKIEPCIRAYRTINQHNQYIYPIYEQLTYGTEPSEIDFYYTQLNDHKVDLDHDIVCLNIIPTAMAKLVIEEVKKLCE